MTRRVTQPSRIPTLKTLCWIVLATVLTACASAVPEPIREPPPGAITLSEARTDFDRVKGQVVRWGGVVLDVENRPGETWLTILSRRLSGKGEPKYEDATEGRFLAVAQGFVDPAVYEVGRMVTVRGPLVDAAVQDVGEHPYFYPIVKAEIHYLWPRPIEPDPRTDPWYWYDPWYPFYHPYWRHPYYW